MSSVKLLCTVFLAMMLMSCGSGLKDMENTELVAKRDECISKSPTSPGRVTACENIRKECERRRKNGNFAC